MVAVHFGEDIDTLVSQISKEDTKNKELKQRTPKIPQSDFDLPESEQADLSSASKKGFSALSVTDATSDSDTYSLFEYVPQDKPRYL